MSYNQRLGRISTLPVNIGREEFEQVARFFNHVFEVYTKSNIINCTCYREAQQAADPDCPLCNGTGTLTGWTKEPVGSFIGYHEVLAERMQDNHQRLYTKGGPVDTFDGRVFADGKWYYKIKLDDVLIFRKKGLVDGVELKIISIIPRYGQNNDIIFIYMDVERQVNPQVKTATNISDTI